MIDSPLLERIGPCIGGEWLAPTAEELIPVHNPATGELLLRVPAGGRTETIQAIDAANRALSREAPIAERRRWLEAIAGCLDANRDELARIITLEQGKPKPEALQEIDYSRGFFQFAASRIDGLQPRSAGGMHHLQWTVHPRPAGVAGLITPWNFPLGMLAKKLSAAIAAGCATVTKPAELTPLSAIAFWNLLQAAGLPMDRLNLVIGLPSPIGKALCEHPHVRIISFTGSTAVGRKLLEQSAPHIKRLALELGGNAPFIVFDDADIATTITGLLANKLRCAGQTCVCANRIYVQKGVLPDFTRELATRITALRVGNGLEPGTDVGPLISRTGMAKVQEHVDDALAHGAVRVAQSRQVPANGNFFPPTLLTGITNVMRLAREETFGPVLGISSFETEEEVIRLANDTPYGLAAYAFTSDKSRAERLPAHLSFGHVGMNTGMGPTPEAPFGGLRQSGIGREGGLEGILEFCELQTVAGK